MSNLTATNNILSESNDGQHKGSRTISDKHEMMGVANVENYKTKLITAFEDMANRGTLLLGPNVTQQDLLMQIIGTIVKT